jgi:UDP-glucose 4-epimerase
MKLLITGTSGFIGGRVLIAACNQYGAENVIAFSSRQSQACQTILYDGPEFKVSAADHALLRTVDVIIHIGAFTPKNSQQASAIEECNSNIRFTENLLSLPFVGLKKMLYTSTIDVYEPSELINEGTPTLPLTLYGWSKLYCEHMVLSWALNKKIDHQILRLGHVYGPGEEKYAKFLPQAIKNILAGKPVEIWGDGSEIRSLIYIDDVVSAILRSTTLTENVGIINVVGGVPLSLREILNQIMSISEKDVRIDFKKFKFEKRDFLFDNKKMLRYLLEEETSLSNGLRNEYMHISESI